MRYLALAGALALAVMSTLALGGCAANIRAADAAIEAKADEALDLAEDARCGRPIDSIARMAQRRGTDWLEGYLLSCPATLGAVMRTLMQQRLERLGVPSARIGEGEGTP
jgi:hypothetical protein